jgi:RNA polymerase sigma-70 factor (ECF subfamily)
MTAFGEPVLLENQDRSLWDCGKILRGFALLARDAPSSWGPYRLQAMIAAEHARAENWKATDWRRIRGYYDFLLASDPSPIVELNRAVAVAYDEGLESGRAQLFSARAELLRRASRASEARTAYERAIALTRNEPERRYLKERLAELNLPVSSPDRQPAGSVTSPPAHG